MKKSVKFILILLVIVSCSASVIIVKGSGNEIKADVSSEPKTDIKIDSLKLLNKDKNLKN